VPVVTERFAREALDAVALDGVARSLDADGEAEPGLACIVGSGDHEEQRIGRSLALPVNGVELRLVGQAARARKASRDWRAIVTARENGQTARRLRPFARRRARTRRPPLVAMRARKPWTRLRCRLLGLNVRFIFGSGGVLNRTGKQDQKQQHALVVKGPGRIRTGPGGVNLNRRYPQAGRPVYTRRPFPLASARRP
jgi:hypothetical protein